MLLLSAILVPAGEVWSADKVQLKEDALILGRILSEKRDQVAIDVGYTVLVVPREHIIAIEKEHEKQAGIEPAPTPTPGLQPTLFEGAGAISEERSVRELVKILGESVVQVRTPSGLGSGFIINEEGFLITNFHVIEDETQISVEVYHQKNGQLERKSYKDVRIVAMNKFEDLALLRIEDKDAPRFARVVLGDSEALSVGDRVFAIGSPLGLERTVTEGILSTKTRQLQGKMYLQTTTQINQGNSGGPLFNMRGQVVGVTNMKMTFGEGLGFAIPIESVKYFLNHRDAFAYDNDNPSSPYRYLEPPNRINKPQGD